jgi:hypothetical protein
MRYAERPQRCASWVGLALLAAWFLPATLHAQGQVTEATDSDFDSGTFSQTSRTGTGAAAEVRLDFAGSGQGLVVATGAEWYNSSWLYRRTVVIHSSHTADLTDYQVLLTLDTQALISGGRLRSDGADLRFTVDDGTTTISHWVESGINTTQTLVWVKVPSLPQTTASTLYMYHGNSFAVDTSTLSGTFVFADDFSGSNGSAPDPGKWTNIQSGSQAGSVLRDIQSNALRIRHGSASGQAYYGLRSNAAQGTGTGARFRMHMTAHSFASDRTSFFAFSDAAGNDSNSQANMLRMNFVHASTPTYQVDRKLSFIPFNGTATNFAGGDHVVEVQAQGSVFNVLLDGSSVLNQNIGFSNPYIYLEAGATGATLQDNTFDSMVVTKFVALSPQHVATGAEQGRYLSTGTYTSSAIDTTAIGAALRQAAWEGTLPGLALQARGHDTDVSLASFVAISSGADLGTSINGRYLQYQASLDTSDPLFTTALSSITLDFQAAPNAPTGLVATGLSSSSLRWDWTDASSGLYAEDGYRVETTTGGLLAALPADSLTWDEESLTANTAYSRVVEAFNIVGTSATATVQGRTLAVPVDVTVDQTSGTWLPAGTAFSAANNVGFGPGAVGFYRYVWNAVSTHTFSDSETLWNSGSIALPTSGSNQYFLHLRSYNDAGAGATPVHLGPFQYDESSPTVTAFTPSSAAWLSATASVDVDLSDTGGSGLLRYRFQWDPSSATPVGGWSSFIPSLSGSSDTISVQQPFEGEWYLHVDIRDTAGNGVTGVSGVYQVDKTTPTGSIVINSDDVATSSSSVALALTFADGVSGVEAVRFRTVPDAFGPYEAPGSTRAWNLGETLGVRTVEMEIRDFAGNTVLVTDDITLDHATLFFMDPETIDASGLTPAQTETFIASATLRFSPTLAPVVGRTLVFDFDGSTGSAVTDAAGVANLPFTVPTSSGARSLTVTWIGEPEFTATSSTVTITVDQRGAIMFAFNKIVNTSGTLTAEANLFDIDTLEDIPNKLVRFVFNGSTETALTDAFGVAAATFTAPLASGTYTMTGAFDGGPIYVNVEDNALVTVRPRRTLLILPQSNIPGNVLLGFNITATLVQIDEDPGLPLQGQPLDFLFEGSTQTVITDAAGTATSNFTAPSSTGVYPYQVSFAGDSFIDYSANVGVVTVGLRGITFTVSSATVLVNTNFNARARMVDTLTTNPIVGSTVSFTHLGATGSAVTDASGWATVIFTATDTAGLYSFNANFPGDTTYSSVNANADVGVILRPTSMIVPNVAGKGNQVFMATATLTDVTSSSGVVGVSIDFVFQGATVTALTDGFGIANATFTAPLAVGIYPLQANFLGDAVYAVASQGANVNVDTRETTLIANNRTTNWGVSFDGQATLVETVGSVPVASKVVAFDFEAQNGNGATNGSGLAIRTFTAPGATGTYSYSADFAGDALFLASSDTANVFVTERPVVVVGDAVLVPLSNIFTATATLTDGVGGAPLSGNTLSFVFQGTTQTAVTNGSGVAFSTFTAPASTGSFSFTVDSTADALYLTGNDAALVAVDVRFSSMTNLPVTVVALEIFSATATLTDLALGTPLVGKTVSFVFDGTTNTAVTDAFGVAEATFTAGAVTGPSSVNAIFSGDETNAAVNDVAVVNIVTKPSDLNARDVAVPASADFNAFVTLTDGVNGTPIVGASVVFDFEGASDTITTDSFGNAIATFTAPASSSVFTYSANFAGDVTYSASADTADVAVGLRFTAIVPFPVTVFAQDQLPLTSKIIELADASPISSVDLDFVFQASTDTGTTDGNGIASSTFTAPSSSGAFRFDVNFDGAGVFVAATASGTATVVQRPTNLTVLNDSCYALNNIAFPALLLDGPTGTGLAGEDLLFDFEGATQTVTTNGSGGATGVFTCGPVAATATVTVSYLGDPTYAAAVDLGTGTTVRRPTSLFPFDSSPIALATFTLRTNLQDAVSGTPLAGESVEFTFQGSTKSGTSQGDGDVFASFNSPVSSGAYAFTVAYAGDLTYVASAGSGTVNVGPRPTTAVAFDDFTFALNLVTLRADLADSITGNPVAGATIIVDLDGSTQAAVTDAFGRTFPTFPAIATAAVYAMSATYLGDPTYATSSSSASLTIGLRPTFLSVPDAESGLNEPFLARATLGDSLSGQPVVGRELNLQFEGASSTDSTNGVGIAESTFTAPGATGNYNIVADFFGDISYDTSSGTGTLVANERPVVMILTERVVSVGRDFYAKVELKDALDASPIVGASVDLVFQGSTHTLITDGVGIASDTFTAPAATGAYFYTGTFAGDATYEATNGTATVTAVLRPTSLVASNANTDFGQNFTASARLVDSEFSEAVIGRTIVFTFQGSSQSAVTNGSGDASVIYSAPASTGSFTFSADFFGDTTYAVGADSATLTADARPVSLVLESVDTSVLQPFGARATLKDGISAAPLAGRTLSFDFSGTTRTVVTNASGVAITTYTAPASTASLSFNVTYAGEALYNVASGTVAVNVGLRATAVLVINRSVSVLEPYSATADLVDVLGGTPIVGRDIIFAYEGSTFSATTDGAGRASVVYNATDTVGVTQYSATFVGDTTYAAESSSASITTGKRPSLVIATDIDAAVNADFLARATLTDDLLGTPLAGATVHFAYSGSTASVLTDGFGIARATFTAPASTGTTQYSATYLGDATYFVDSDTASVTTGLRTTTIIGTNRTIYVNNAFTASATLLDSASGSGVVGRTLEFVFEGSTLTAITNGVGFASVVYGGTGTVGGYTYSIDFFGDTTYEDSNDSASVNVIKRPTRLTGLDGASFIGEVFTATATLEDVDLDGPLVGETVTFTFEGSTLTDISNGSGEVTVVFAAPAASGTYNLVMDYFGSSLYVADSDTRTLTNNRRPSDIVADNLTIGVSADINARVVLTDVISGNPLVGETVEFVFQGATHTVLTNGLGVAATTYAAPSSTGAYTYSTSFAGTATQAPKSDDGDITVELRGTVMLASPVTVLVNNQFTATTQLKDTESSNGIAGKTLIFQFLSSSGAAVTDGSGFASVIFTAPGSSQTASFNATFLGDNTYAAGSSTGTVTVDPRPTTMVAIDRDVNASELFLAEVSLIDTDSSSAMVGETVTFDYLGSIKNAVTNGVGVATASYTSPSSTGPTTFSATFIGGPVYLTISDTGTITVTEFQTTLVIDTVTVTVGSLFTATGTLTQVIGGTPVSGKTVTFNFEGVPLPAVTDAGGVATVVYTAPAASGTYTLTGNFPGDSAFAASANAAEVIVTPLGTEMASGLEISVFALEPFTATGTLTLSGGGPAVSGKPVDFTFQASTAVDSTDGSGEATVFLVANSSGAWLYNADFAGDSSHAGSSSGAVVNVSARPTSISAPAVAGVFADEIFTASATVTDDRLGGAAISGVTVDFNYLGSPQSAVTNGSGLATVTYNAGQSTGTYNYTASAKADATYATSSDNTNSVTVNPRPVGLVAQDVTAFVSQLFTASATVTDTRLGTGILGATVTFVYQGSNLDGYTNAAGLATVVYNAGVSTGTHNYTAQMVATEKYGAASDNTNTVTVAERTTTLVADPAVTYVNETWIATATLTDNFLGGAPVVGRTVDFVFRAGPQSAVTNALGIATVSYSAGASSGPFNLTANFSGDLTYAASSDLSTTITVQQRPVTLTAVDEPSIYANEVYTASATITDNLAGGSPVNGLTIDFSYLGSDQSSVSNASGFASVTYNAGPSTGTHNFTSEFDGDTVYAFVADNTNSVNVLARPTSLVAPNIGTVATNQLFTASATVTDDRLGGAAVPGVSVDFTYQAQQLSGITNGAGLATVVFNADVSSGTYNITAVLQAAAPYGGSSDVANSITVSQRTTSLSSPNNSGVFTLEVFTATATLTDDLGGVPVSGANIDFAYFAQNLSDATDGSGVATVIFNAGASSGSYNYTSTFVENGTYIGSSDTANSVPVNPRPTSLEAATINTFVNEVFISSGSLTDDRLGGIGIDARPVAMTYLGSTEYGLSDTVGLATAAINAGVSSGTFNVAFSYVSDATYIGSNDATTNIVVDPRPTTLVADAATVFTLEVFTATATLTDDLAGGAAIAGQSVDFLFQGVPLSATTNGLGIATVTYSAGASSGTQNFTASYTGVPTYAASSDNTNAVTINQRPITVTGDAEPGVYALENYVATATVTDDRLGGAAVAGLTVDFLYLGTPLSAVTNALGVATVTYAGGPTAGTFNFTSVFAGDPTYAAGADNTNGVDVLVRPTDIQGVTVPAVFANEQYTATATLTDVRLGGAAIAGKNVDFDYLGTPITDASDGAGQATAVYNAGSSSGTYSYDAEFDGDTTYASSQTAPVAVTVNPRPTTLIAQAVTTFGTEVFTASATFTDDRLGGAGISGKNISFDYFGSIKVGVTDGSGFASVTYNAGVATGTYNYTADFAADATYVAASDATNVVTVQPRPTSLNASPVSTFVSVLFTASATFTDDRLAGAGISGRNVSFYYMGSTQVAASNGSGLATTVFNAGVSSGSFNFTATFIPDELYAGTDDALNPVTINPRPTTLVADDATVFANEVFTATATVTDNLGGGTGIAGLSVDFSYLGVPLSAITNALGVATITYNAGASTGTHAYTATFAGVPTYAASLDPANSVTVVPRPTTLVGDAVPSVFTLETFVATATLTDDRLGGTGLAGKSIQFDYESDVQSKITNALGVATYTYAAGTDAGSFNFTSQFFADDTYAGATDNTNAVTVVKRPLTLVADAVPAIFTDEVFSATATITDDRLGGAAVAGLSVSFNYLGSGKVAVTNALGVATVTYNAGQSSGTLNYTADFNTTNTYLAANDATNPVTVNPRPTTLVAPDLGSVFAAETFTASATVTDDRLGGAGITGISVRFDYLGTIQSGITDGTGLATTLYAVGTASGSYNVTAEFLATPKYLGATDLTNAITVTQRPVTLVGDAVASVLANAVFTASATLTDDRLGGAAIVGSNIDFDYLAAPLSDATNGSGLATVTYNAGASSGSYNFTSIFSADPTYLGGSDLTNVVTVVQRPTTLVAAVVPAVYALEVFTTSATITDDASGGAAVTGVSIDFVYAGGPLSGVSNGSGLATQTYSAGASSGTKNFTADFIGGPTYAASSDATTSVTVLERPTGLSSPDAGTVFANATFVATATLTDTRTGGSAIVGRTVDFSYKSQNFSAVTNGVGVASVTFNSESAQGAFNYTSDFPGDPTYAASSDNTNTVIVARRPTSLVANDVPAVFANELFTASGTLTDDLLGGAAINGETIDFDYLGDGQSGVTAGTGLATFVYNAGAASGTVNFTASYGGSSTYDISSDTVNSVTVVQRPLTLTADAVAIIANETFVATATVTDDRLGGAAVAGLVVRFDYQSGVQFATTNGIGVATSAYNAGAAAGTFNYTADYLAGPTYAAANDATNAVVVSSRPTTVSGPDIGTVFASELFTASATLTDDRLGGAALAGLTVRFDYLGTVQNETTDGAGLATSIFNSGTASGTANVLIDFLGDATYSPSTDGSNSITVSSRPTSLAAQDVVTNVAVLFTASATVTDDRLGGTGVAGLTVEFFYEGTTTYALTDALGLAVSTYNAGASSGVFAYTARFLGTPTYLSSDDLSNSVQVFPRPTTISGDPAPNAFVNEMFTASATLSEFPSAVAVVGSTVTFGYGGSSVAVPTEALGLATNLFAAGGSSGTYNFVVDFPGDDTFGPSSDSNNAVTVAPRPVTIVGSAVPAIFANEIFTASATLTDTRLGGAAIVGETMRFTYKGQVLTAPTNASGFAAVVYNAGSSSGTLSFLAELQETSVYAAGTDTPAVTVQPRPTTLNGAAVASVIRNELFLASATLTDDRLGGAAIAGQTIDFTYGASTAAALTDAGGTATTFINAGASTGTYNYTAVFTATPTYVGATDNTNSVNVVPRPTGLAVTPTADNIALELVATSATLTDVLAGTPIVGESVSFFFAGSTRTGITDALGIATTHFVTPASSGTYTLTGSFLGTALFETSFGTGPVGVVARPTTWAPLPVVAVVLELFKTTATLTDAGSGTPLTGRSVTFSFEGASSTVVTDALGVATATFTAPSSSGAFVYGVEFLGDAQVAFSSATAVVNTIRRGTVLSVTSATVFALDVFTATATLIDLDTSGPLNGLGVNFTFSGQTPGAVTNASGEAPALFTAPASSGVYTIDADFPGSPAFISSTASAQITVQPRFTALVADATTGLTLGNFNAAATLTDLASGSPLAGRSLNFVFQGTTQAAVTNGAGVATSAFALPSSSGAYLYQVNFVADATYVSSDTIAVVTALPRPTRIAVSPVAAPALDTFSISGDLEDVVTGAKIATRLMRFVFEGTTATATTDGLGQATTNFVMPAIAGPYAVSFYFDGDPTYVASTQTVTATAQLRGTQLVVEDSLVVAGQVFLGTATLVDSGTASPIPGKSVLFRYFDGVAPLGIYNSGVSDAAGVANATYTAPSNTGLFELVATFAGDQTYSVVTDTGFIQVGVLTSLIASDVTGIVLEEFTLSAQLIDVFTQPVASAPISFAFEGTTVTVLTDGFGVAQATFTAPGSSGTFSALADYPGDANFAPSNDTINVQINLRGTSLAAFDETTSVGLSFEARAKIIDDATSIGIGGQPVSFQFEGSTIPAVSNALGIASVTFTAPATSGTYIFDVAFAGDSVYSASADSTTVTVDLRPTTILVFDQSADANDPFTMQARLLSLVDGSPIVGVSVNLGFEGTTVAVITDALGQAATSFNAPAASGTYVMNADFAGDGTYVTATANGNLGVGLRGTSMSGVLPNPYALQTFIATATLTDIAGGVGIATRPVLFTWLGTSVTVYTDLLGVATTTLVAPGAIGSFPLSLEFTQDATFSASSTTLNVSVDKRPTLLVVPAALAPASAVFTATATLSDTVDSSLLNGAVIVFSVDGATQTAITDALGVAVSTYTAPATSGTFVLSAAYGGAALYTASAATTTLTVLQRTADVTAAPVTAIYNEVFVASATITDAGDASPLVGQTLIFAYAGSTETRTSDASGIASATFTALAVGTFTFSVDFPGDATFLPVNESGALTVDRRPTAGVVNNASVLPLQVFTATVTVTDLLSGSPLSGTTVTFTVAAATASALTDAAGVASALIGAPSSTGTVTISATSPGDAFQAPMTSSGTLLIVSAPLQLIAFDASGFLGEVFTTSATIEDGGSGSPLPGQTLSFLFEATTRTAVSDGAGLAVSTFSAPASSGTYPLAVDFAGGGGFAPGNDTSVITIVRRPTNLAPLPIVAVALQIFQATATLTDVRASSPIAGRSVDFVFQGTTQTVISDVFGVAVASFTAPGATGSFAYLTVFNGDALYQPTSELGVVTVGSGGSGGSGSGGGGTLLEFESLFVEATQAFTATATLKVSGDGTPIPGKVVSVAFDNSSHSLVTDAFGMVFATFTAPAATGTYFALGDFSGDAIFDATFTTETVTVAGLPTSLAVPGITAETSAVFIASATLTSKGSGIAAQSLTFAFEGTSVTAFTDGIGFATAAFTAPAASGTYNLSVNFLETPLYLAALTTAQVLVDVGGGSGSSGGGGGGTNAVVLLGVSSSAVSGGPVTMGAYLRDSAANVPVTGRSVLFTFQGTTQAALTDGAGLAESIFTAPIIFGEYAFDAFFAGDSTYTVANGTATIIVGPGLVPIDPAVVQFSTVGISTATLIWSTVTLAMNGASITPHLSGYLIERSVDIDQGWSQLAFVATGTANSYTVPVSSNPNVHYRVRARTFDLQHSAGLVAARAQTQSAVGRVYIAADNFGWVQIPEASNQELQSGAGAEPRRIVLEPLNEPGFVASYFVRVQEGVTYIDDFIFEDSDAGVSLVFSIDLARTSTQAAFHTSANSQLALFFWNGVEWIKLGGVNDINNGEVSLNLRRFGKFAVRFETVATNLEFTKVAPRIFTPEETVPEINKTQFYFQNPGSTEITIKIFDVTGARIRRNLPKSSPSIYFWDGRDDNGSIVKGGIYLYQIEAAGEVKTGTVVVAK